MALTFLLVLRVGLRCMIVVFPDHTQVKHVIEVSYMCTLNVNMSYNVK